MKPACLLWLGLAGLFSACTRQSAPELPKPSAREETDKSQAVVRSAKDNMVSVVNELRAVDARGGTPNARAAGDLWLDVEKLKRAGRNTREIEGYVSELEGSLRRGPEDATTRRHILNNLDYELRRK
jgi:hypothetical protein